MMSFSQFVNEDVSSFRQRMDRSRAMKRHSGLIKSGRKFKEKRKVSREELVIRAERQARRLIRDKICGENNYRDLSPMQKIKVDKKIEMYKPKMKILARKLLPKVIEDEKIRIEKKKALSQTT